LKDTLSQHQKNPQAEFLVRIFDRLSMGGSALEVKKENSPKRRANSVESQKQEPFAREESRL